MLEQYQWIWARYEELSEEISQPEIIADTQRYNRALQERSSLEEQAFLFHRYQAAQEHLAQARELAEDPDLAQEAEREIEQIEDSLDALRQEMRRLLIPRDEDDDKSVVMEIRAGAGGEEAGLFAADLYRMYSHYAAKCHFRVEPLSISETDLGGIREAVFLVTGKGAFSRLKYESGVHRVQRVPVTDTTGKKQTSTCTVAVLPEAEEVELSIDPKDIRVDVYRASGHGGQYINKTDSAVRITHLPSGIVVTCQDEKSQLKNREQAMKVLRSRLLERQRSEADAAYAERRRLQVGTGDRSERVRTYNFHEGRVSDHRVGLTLYKINQIMDGDLDEIVDALRAEEQARRMQAAANA